MPTQPDHQPLRVGSPTDLLAVVPHLLGFIPGHSLVIAGARGPRLRIEVTLRFDLPDPPDGRSRPASPRTPSPCWPASSSPPPSSSVTAPARSSPPSPTRSAKR